MPAVPPKLLPGLMAIGALLCAWAMSSCVLPPTGSNGRPAHRRVASLREVGGRYLLDRPFQDFYDTAFVWTNAGKTAPRVVSLAELADGLLAYDVVFYGESHAHPGVHLQQMKLLRALYERDAHWVLSFEQFERDVQSVVDDYLAGRIGETALIEKGRAWNNYTTSYRPLLLFAKQHHLPVIAAEAPRWTITCVGKWGTGILDQFTPLERSWVAADLHVTPGAYRDEFMQFLGGSATHGGGPATTPEAAARAERSFAAQATRDDTMAESIERALQTHPGYKLLHLTGSFHSEGFLGTVERLRLRDPTLKIAVIDPIEVSDPSAPAFTSDSARGGTVLQLIYPNPDDFVEGEDMSAWTAKMTHERETDRCKYELPAAAPRPDAS
ncbi:MAG: ChaN family lipoprotein [Steroidobacteraceae bacterium]